SNHFLQVHAGTAAATTTHVLLHDADLFIEDPGFMARHYRRCADEGLACLGVSPAWDDWLREHGFGHVVATWELMMDTRWAREFAPWQPRNHRARLDGEEHAFDLTLYPQALTAPARCALHDATASLEHFNYVLGIYRNFQRARGAPFEDSGFQLLLIRLLSDALESAPGDVPAASPPAGRRRVRSTTPVRRWSTRPRRPASIRNSAANSTACSRAPSSARTLAARSKARSPPSSAPSPRPVRHSRRGQFVTQVAAVPSNPFRQVASIFEPMQPSRCPRSTSSWKPSGSNMRSGCRPTKFCKVGLATCSSVRPDDRPMKSGGSMPISAIRPQPGPSRAG